MPRFFTDAIDENNITITGADAVHIGRSLRMRPGEEITVCCCGTDYSCTIRSITSDTVYLDLISRELCAAEPTVEVTLYQAVPKLDKLETIIQNFPSNCRKSLAYANFHIKGLKQTLARREGMAKPATGRGCPKSKVHSVRYIRFLC